VAYKTAKIDELMTRLPWVRWVLVGDDGEKDPEIYQTVRERYPKRVRAVWIRRVHPDPNRARYAGQGDLATALARRR
jgi:phosphatidate phosphatase APP1